MTPEIQGSVSPDAANLILNLLGHDRAALDPDDTLSENEVAELQLFCETTVARDRVLRPERWER